MRINFLLAALSILVLLTTGCKSKKDISGKITTGKRTNLAKQTIGTEGGIIIIDQPGDPLKGLTINIPANAYSSKLDFEISSSPIEQHQFGNTFRPITPLIRISNGGGDANGLITLSIPVIIPPGTFAMAFMYNDKTGELEGMPFSGPDEPGRISVITKRFSSGETNRSLDHLAAQAGGPTDISYAEIVVSCIDTALLSGTHISPFRPGVDDWTFHNRGSYIAPGGHCAGQSIGMMWYYHYKKKTGSPGLYGRLDNDGNHPPTPLVWQDDALAYKFCSMVQNDWENMQDNVALVAWQKNNDTRSFMAFSYSILQTNEPQLAVIFPSGDKYSHAILVYGVRNDSLLIVDPNKPGRENMGIAYRRDDKVFQPYFTALKAGDNGMQFHYIYYYAKSAIKSWTNAATRWQEVAGKTIGEDAFPSFTIMALDEQNEFVPFADGFTVPPGGRLTLNIRCKETPTRFSAFSVYGSQFPAEDTLAVFITGQEQQRVGICVTDVPGHWIGFKWATVNISSSEPASIEGKGRLILELTIDGVPARTDSTLYAAHDIDGLTLEAYGERYTEGIYAYTHTLSIRLHSFRGPGTYKMDNEPGTMFWQFKSFYINPSVPGSLTVTEWNRDVINGYFSFEADDGYGNKKKVEGRFRK